MSTLLLRLSGPMQSWGTQSRFSERDTGLEPSKSGVIGLLCAALGRSRSEPVADLVSLRMGVRVEREGVMQRDYHTTGGTHRQNDPYGVAKPDGGILSNAVLSNRYYLADAEFLVGLEGDVALLQELDRALKRPRWQLCLGRKAFPPGAPVRLPDAPPWGPGLRDGSLREVLSTYPWLGHLGERWRGRPPEQLRLILDAGIQSGYEVRQDVPVSFAGRSFSTRYVLTEWVDPPPVEGDETCTSHS
ncbi:type I-E CRISPR-associated protein Cas5/CasD [Nitrolancea hollandica]|uniref:CRISPR-associated protein Cas5 family n=1 Tax=Nitrolancea hollandica Lb TaxID=1129897 RepID=I4EM56_9BACT|nr:CRISPR-associated protein Cas5 family [Nitrolancea hollandica Lb]